MISIYTHIDRAISGSGRNNSDSLENRHGLGFKGRSFLWGILFISGLFNTVPGLDPLNATRTLSVMTTKNVTGHCQMFPGCQNYPQI